MYHALSEQGLSLIQQAHQFAPTYSIRLSNHLPMAITAMERLGATREQLIAQYQDASRALEPLAAPKQGITPELGNSEHVAEFIEHFSRKLHETGLEATISNTLPTLLPGIAAGSFHAVIRLAYAIEREDNNEISHALAYWSAGYTPLGAIRESESLNADDQLNHALMMFYDQRYSDGIMIDHVEELITLDAYPLSATQPATLPIEDVARVVLNQYIASNDFTLLHGVTGLQALHSLKPYLPDFDVALKYYWQAYVAAACTARYREPTKPSNPVESVSPDWPTWFKQANATGDDHTIKLTYSCARLYEALDLPEALHAIHFRLEGSQ
ncbi:questin oxidase family protein [Enterovibrio coralii]|uniref:Questin oxidase family protein n=1 Tax=Enterovibrio coralii TaxID=294935 RepID=A0A135I2I0_9GAMM|nr:questin oxidase family protein [Enterovibrio coralii]KXF79624.1 hypothetical protein ATN88_15175 [Enterovibrio coralii]